MRTAGLRILYTNDLLWGQVNDNLARRLALEDEIFMGDKSWIQEVSRLSQDREVPDVTKEERGKRTMKRLLRDKNELLIWI